MSRDKPIYKRSDRDKRRLIQDGSFFKGMYYTNNLVDSSTLRLLLNYNLRDNGNYISPRMGISMTYNEKIRTYDRPYTAETIVPGPHVRYYGVYRDKDGLDKFGTITLSFGVPSDPEFKYYYTKDKQDSSYYDQTFINKGTAFGFVKDSSGDIFPIDVSAIGETRLRFYKNTPKPLFTIFNNKLYVIDGKADSSNSFQDYKVTGAFPRYAEFAYDGKFNNLVITPNNTDVPELSFETYSMGNVRTGGITLPIPLRYLASNGVTDVFDMKAGVVKRKINELSNEQYAEGCTVEELTKVAILKIPKPEDSIMYDNVSGDVFRTSNLGTQEELNVTENSVLDSFENLGKYTVRADAKNILVVVPSSYTVEEALETLETSSLRYELSATEDFLVDVSEPLVVSKGGFILFSGSNGYFPVIATYDITYKQPILTYSGGLLEVEITRGTNGFAVRPVPVTAKKPTISEATSVGFNMLLPNPYSFQNKEGLVLRPQGIMPYVPKTNQQISMSANLGEEIEFEVFYEYIKGAKYFVKWEYLGVGVGETNIEPIVLQDYGSTITAGTRISRVIKANDKRFSLRVTIAPPDKNSKPDEVLAKVITYPIYETGNTYLKDISSYKYDLHNARGLGSYKTMLCLWGVPGADTTLFFSDIDDVSYFPFPNNIVSFDYKILGVQNYQGGLLIFTSDSIYLLTGNIASKFEVVELYQNLKFTKEDVESLIVIKNIIFIRSGSSYYTLVPNNFTGELADLKLTNVSAPIKELVDDWTGFLEFLGKDVFDWKLSFTHLTKIEEYDFFNYVDDSKIKNVYRFGLSEQVGPNFYRYQVDVVLIFNTNKGTWTVETMNLPFSDVLATSEGLYASYAREFGEKTKFFYEELDYKNSSRIDIYNTSRYGEAFNDIVTSPREHELQKLPSVVTDKIVRVIDGDTVVLEKLGNFRFLYINTPEYTTVHEDYGSESTSYAKQLLPVGSTVRIEFEGNRSDKYDRAMGWIFNKDDLLVQLKMAEAGTVKSVYSFGATKYANEIDLAITKAEEDKVGMWAFTKGKTQYIYANATITLLPNYQVFDTGNKNQDPYLQKRYREFQFQIINRSEDNLEFFSRFYVESVPQQNYRDYEIHHETDRLSPNYGTIEVVPVDTSNLEVSAATFLNTWKLGVNQFPEIDIMKVRFRISGKGRYGRMLLISKNQANYDLLSFAWVYRAMNYR